MQFIALPLSAHALRKSVMTMGLIVFLAFQPVLVTSVFAQTVSIVDDSAPLLATPSATPGTSPAPSGSPLPSPSPENVALTNLREKYKTDLSIYRTDERDYNLAKQQYNNLQTLAALEAAVKATRKVLLSRATVLQDYLGILQLMVTDTSGIDVAEKAELLTDLKNTADRMKVHQTVVEQAIDRDSILTAVKDFNEFSKGTTSISYKALSYINYGRLQTVYDKMLSVRDEVSIQVASLEKNGLKQGEKQRAMDEINRNLASTKTQLDNVHKTFVANQFGTKAQFDNGSYVQTVNSTSAIYAELFRNLSFLREVIKP